MSSAIHTQRSIVRLAAVLALASSSGCVREKAEGRPWIHRISILGCKHVSQKDLKGKLGVQQTSWIPWAAKHYLDPYALPLERDRIVAFFRDHGYFDARVTSAAIKPRKTKDSVDIEFKVEEGDPVKIDAVVVDGLDGLGPIGERLKKRLLLKPGDVFVYSEYTNDKARLARVIEEKGYAWVKVSGDVEVDRGLHIADVHLVAVPGLKARFGKVTVEGEKKVRAIDIERTADIVEGADFTPAEVEEARGRVYNVGVFGAVKLSYDHDPVDPSIANVTVKVHGAQFRELKLGGGIGIEAQRNDLHLIGSYTKRNFLGGMRILRLSLEPAIVVLPAVWDLNSGQTVRYGPAITAEATLVQPFLGGLRHLELHWTVGYDVGIDYAYQFEGPRTQLGVVYALWRKRVQLGLSYNFQFLDFFNTDPTILSNPDLATSLYGYVDPYRLGWWQQDLSLDLRDNRLDPHKGIYLLATLEEGGAYAGGAFEYEKIVPDARAYAPFGKRVTLAGRFQYGEVFVQGDLGSPITRRLYLGGPSSHRGFTYNRLSYQVASSLPGVNPIPIGGDQSVLMQLELRIKMFKLFDNWFGAVVFADGGDVSTPTCNKVSVAATATVAAHTEDSCTAVLGNALHRIDFTQLHWAVGGGLRYKTVIGTIRADVGVRVTRVFDPAVGPPVPDPGDRIAFHISVGEAF